LAAKEMAGTYSRRFFSFHLFGSIFSFLWIVALNSSAKLVAVALLNNVK
jgi:hypothetical protein